MRALSRSRTALATAAALALGGALTVAGFAAPASAAPLTTTYATPGDYTFVIPVGITSIHVVALGGSGGGAFNAQVGGAGAQLTEDLAVTPGDTYFIHVAGNGQVATAVSNGAGANGGGGTEAFGGAGGGGGASDLRLGADTLAARVVVAGGGGGLSAFANGGAANSDGADGSCPPAATKGSLVAGGTGGAGCDGSGGTDGSLGQGGDGGFRESGNNGGGGGGAGVYGGGGGGAFGSGAGGSSQFGAGASNTGSVLGTIGETPFVSIAYDVTAATALTVTASKTTITANGTPTSTVTAHVTDAILTGVPGETVVFSSSDPAQTFGPVTDNGDGTYSAVLTSSTTVGTATITATDTSALGSVTGTIAITQTAVLATTGVDPSPALGLAALLILLGAAGVTVRRRIRAI